MRGKWAMGITPRYFCWIIKDRLAVSERPGGYARNHRRVRRQEEIIWLREQHFSRIVSLLAYPQLKGWLESGERLIVHMEELGDRLMGILGGYLLWSGMLETGPQTITVMERIVGRQMGPAGRELIALVPAIPKPQ